MDAKHCRGAQRDPSEGLSHEEIARRLQVCERTVSDRERAGELFSILRRGRREYPAFQTWDDIRGEPLSLVMVALGRPSGPEAYAFLTSPTDALGGISPVEALVGVARVCALQDDVREFLAKSSGDRLEAVVHAARAYAATLQA